MNRFLLSALFLLVASSVAMADMTPDEAAAVDQKYRQQAQDDQAHLARSIIKGLQSADEQFACAGSNLRASAQHLANATRKSQIIGETLPDVVTQLDNARDDVHVTAEKIGEWERMAKLPEGLFQGGLAVAKQAGGLLGLGIPGDIGVGSTGLAGIGLTLWMLLRKKNRPNPALAMATEMMGGSAPPPPPPVPTAPRADAIPGQYPTNSGTYVVEPEPEPSNGRRRR